MRHADALEFAVDDTLPTIDATVLLIFHHVPLGSAVEDRQFYGIGWAVFYT